jgi:hypothetical protein
MNPPGQPCGAASTGPPPRRILLIDDNDGARELLGMALELKDHAVATADGGIRGLARARSAGFDHHMPKPADFGRIDGILRGDIAPFAKLPLRQASRHL